MWLRAGPCASAGVNVFGDRLPETEESFYQAGLSGKKICTYTTSFKTMVNESHLIISHDRVCNCVGLGDGIAAFVKNL